VDLLLATTESMDLDAPAALKDLTSGPRIVRKLLIVTAYIATLLLLPVAEKVYGCFCRCSLDATFLVLTLVPFRNGGMRTQAKLAVSPASIMGKLMVHLDLLTAPLHATYVETPLVAMVGTAWTFLLKARYTAKHTARTVSCTLRSAAE